ncbi:MAG: type II toxin-antitoxin system VapC family toxin [Pseudomonadota bacterium]
MGPFVVDASAIAGTLFEDEDPAYANAVLEEASERGAIVPGIFWYEIRNMLLIGERRGRVERDNADEQIKALRLAGIAIAPEAGDLETLAMARAHNLSSYDAAYAVLAAKEKTPLATLDKKLIAAGEAGAFQLWRS